MFTMSSSLQLDGLARLADRLETDVRAGVRAIAAEIEADAQARCPVDTGFLRASIGRVTDQETTYGQAGNARETFPAPPLPSGIGAAVAVGATYGVFLEYGVHGRAAQPFFTPAVESARQRFLPTLESAV